MTECVNDPLDFLQEKTVITENGRRRLDILIDFMEALPPEAEQHFDMIDWVNHKGDSELDGAHGLEPGSVIDDSTVLVQCGMAACALGWGAVCPALRQEGLRLEINNAGFAHPIFREYRNFDAAAKFFEISHGQAECLFSIYESESKTPRDWAAHARSTIERWRRLGYGE